MMARIREGAAADEGPPMYGTRATSPPRAKGRGDEVGCRLYNVGEELRERQTATRDSIHRHERSTHQPKISDASRKLSRGMAPISERVENIRRAKEEYLENARQMDEERERAEATHRPQITAKAQNIERGQERRERWECQRKRRLNMLREEVDQNSEETRNCTFQPQLSPGTERLARQYSLHGSPLQAKNRSRSQPPSQVPGGVPEGSSSPEAARSQTPCGQAAPLSFEDFMSGYASPATKSGGASLAAKNGGVGSRISTHAPMQKQKPLAASDARTRCAEVVPFEAFKEAAPDRVTPKAAAATGGSARPKATAKRCGAAARQSPCSDDEVSHAEPVPQPSTAERQSGASTPGRSRMKTSRSSAQIQRADTTPGAERRTPTRRGTTPAAPKAAAAATAKCNPKRTADANRKTRQASPASASTPWGMEAPAPAIESWHSAGGGHEDAHPSHALKAYDSGFQNVLRLMAPTP